MNKENYRKYGYTGNGKAEDILEWALNRFQPDIVLACSFQHPVLIHMALNIRKDIKIVAVDTGRLPEETYECATQIERMFEIKIHWYLPDFRKLEGFIQQKGLFSFKDSLEARKNCCAIRKIEPMNRALKGVKAWITGVRRDQGVTRKNIQKISIDQAHDGIIKISPLADWSEHQVRDYIKKYRLPYNRLMESGYRSIGCACCTRPVEPGEDPRAGRWWWENPENKECGLHVPNWSI